MTKDEVLKLALSTLKEVRSETFRLLRNGQKLYAEEKVWNTITAIEEVLSKNEFNPDWDTQAVLVEEMQRMAKRIEKLEAQPSVSVEQEPVAWRHDMGEENGGWEYFEEASCPNCQPLYTTPPQRKPLSDDEIALIVAECASSAHRHDDFSFARAIEAAHGIKGEA